ncbi:MAG: serine hydrolase [Acidobacteriota bacterium]|nr:serine hydrolase [Acidobacteriota bacterium]
MRVSIGLLFFCVWFAVAGGHPHTEHIADIEKGLRPAGMIDGSTWTLEERMEHYGVPAMSIAVIQDYKVVWYKVYGKADRETGAPAGRETLFQAGSISKPVAAMGAMKMVQDGRLELRSNVNDKLKSWKIPDNDFTAKEKVNLAHLLSHTGGLTVHGFPGYAPGVKVPTTVQVLDGNGPTNTAPIRVNKLPGEGYRYSGGGYTVAQLLMTDVSGQSFPQLMQERVLGPLGMGRSTYLNPLPPALLKNAAAGILPDRSAVVGKRHTYPEMAAAGLWTTAEDLAAFAIEVQMAVKGKGKVLSKETAGTMLTPVDAGYALGFGIENRDGETYFGHSGWDAGFCARLTAHRDKGYGVAVMINANFPSFMNEVIRGVALEYGWAGYKLHQPQPVPANILAGAPGRYRYNADQGFQIERKDKRLFMRYYGDKPRELVHIGDNRFMRHDRETPVTFKQKDGAMVFHFILPNGKFQTHQRLTDEETIPRQLLDEGHYDKALAAYRALKDKKNPNGSEGYLNNQGFGLLQNRRFDAAIRVFRIACDLYPKSANTWDSLGFGYKMKGDKANAIKYYRKALEIDPKFSSAVSALAQLEKN